MSAMCGSGVQAQGTSEKKETPHFLFFSWENHMYPGLASNVLFSKRWPWTPSLSASTSHVLGLQLWPTVTCSGGAGGHLQPYVLRVLKLYELTPSPVLTSWIFKSLPFRWKEGGWCPRGKIWRRKGANGSRERKTGEGNGEDKCSFISCAELEYGGVGWQTGIKRSWCDDDVLYKNVKMKPRVLHTKLKNCVAQFNVHIFTSFPYFTPKLIFEDFIPIWRLVQFQFFYFNSCDLNRVNHKEYSTHRERSLLSGLL